MSWRLTVDATALYELERATKERHAWLIEHLHQCAAWHLRFPDDTGALIRSYVHWSKRTVENHFHVIDTLRACAEAEVVS